MLFDRQAYLGCERGPFIEIAEPSDVSNLNALQLHHSQQAVYFANPRHAAYVRQLYAVHKPLMVKPLMEFRVRNDLLIDDKPSQGEVLHSFEPQLNHELSLSFISCDVLDPSEFVFRRRSPELVEAHKAIALSGKTGAPSAFSICPSMTLQLRTWDKSFTNTSPPTALTC